jgi:hypothetical protein
VKLRRLLDTDIGSIGAFQSINEADIACVQQILDLVELQSVPIEAPVVMRRFLPSSRIIAAWTKSTVGFTRQPRTSSAKSVRSCPRRRSNTGSALVKTVSDRRFSQGPKRRSTRG